MAPDILLAPQGGTCATIQTECCVFIPDESFNITHLMNHMKNQISALSDHFPGLDDLKKKNKLLWCGRIMAEIFTIPLMLLICILPVL